jgi:hypothetical protein
LRPVECKLKMNIQGNQAPTKWQKMFKKYEKSFMNIAAE